MPLHEKSFRPRVIVDTHVVVSAALSPRGAPAEMVAFAIRGDITCFASVETLRELFVVFSREHIALRLRPAPNILQNYLRVLIIVLPITYTTGVLPDSSDEKFLDAAIAANADFIISGDSRLLELKQFCGIRIVSAKEFLASTHK